MPHYIESSAFVKLVIREPGSDALRVWYSSFGRYAVTCDLTRTEMLRAVRRLAPDLISKAREALEAITVLTVTVEMFEHAGMLDPLNLRSLEALHLAGARSLGSQLEGVVTYDSRLAQAAEMMGIRTLSPE